ncbi:hypothetical protein [uncultured Cyclobacterium sp.]|uniref:hypothetical protein n=1 Tax=uncultured Cyclobacterium sp. TaxID=453820 RepID=UPI0030EE3D30|tara:strand:- start:83162 stop:83356 length:195 start_codon:yes stop_codon:yes gene_type:complete
MKRFILLSEPTEMLYNQGKSAMTDYHIIAAIVIIQVDKAREILALAEAGKGEKQFNYKADNAQE